MLLRLDLETLYVDLNIEMHNNKDISNKFTNIKKLIINISIKFIIKDSINNNVNNIIKIIIKIINNASFKYK